MEKYKFKELNEIEYQSFALNHPQASFQQSVSMMQVQKMEGKEICYLGVEKEGFLVAACGFTLVPVLKIFKYMYANRGILIDYQDQELLNFYFKYLLHYAQKRHVLYCRIDPNFVIHYRDNQGNITQTINLPIVSHLQQCHALYCGKTIGFDLYSQMRFMYILDLKNKTKDQLFKNMSKHTQWSISKALKMKVQVKELNLNELSIFKQIMNHTAQRNHFDDRSLSFYENMKCGFKEHFHCLVAQLDTELLCHEFQETILNVENEIQELKEKDNLTLRQKRHLSELFEIHQNKQRQLQETQASFKEDGIYPIAVASFIAHQKELVCFSAGSYEKYMHYNGTFAIHWYMLQWALEHGYERYNFYGISGDFTENAIDHGVFEFKKGFNGFIEEYVGDFIFEINPLFKVYNKIRKIV